MPLVKKGSYRRGDVIERIDENAEVLREEMQFIKSSP